jgi:hypothetical protein
VDGVPLKMNNGDDMGIQVASNTKIADLSIDTTVYRRVGTNAFRYR